MMIEVRWSKVLQFREKILRFPALPTGNKAICPVFWMHHMITSVEAGPLDPLFSLPHRKQKIALSANQLVA